MATILRRGTGLGLILAAALTSGCNLGSLAYFLFGPSDFLDPVCPAFASPKKDTKVVFLVNVGMETRPEFLRADRELAEVLSQRLGQNYRENKDKFTIVSTAEVENFKQRNPYWQTKSMREIGNYFHADLVVNIDLDKLDLYEPLSNNQFFRGRGDVSVTVFDMAKPANESRVWQHDHSFIFPRNNPRAVIDNPNPSQFRAEFMAHMINELVRWFGKYTNDQKYAVEE